MDLFLLGAPILLLAIIALLGFVGCDRVFGLEHLDPLPLAVTAIVPPSGSPSGGTMVKITGGEFQSGATVTFGGAAADPQSVVLVSASEIDVFTPPHSPGAVKVVVTNPDDTSGSLDEGFTYGITHVRTFSLSKLGSQTVTLPPISGGLIVVVAQWTGAGTFSFNNQPPLPFTQVEQDDVGPLPVHTAIFFANNVMDPVNITGNLSTPSLFTMIASAYDFADPNAAPDQANHATGSGMNLSLSFPTTGLTAGDLIYAVAVSMDMNGALAGTLTAGTPPFTARTFPPPGFILAQDYVVLPQDITSGQVNIVATNQSGAPNSGWYLFGMRLKHG